MSQVLVDSREAMRGHLDSLPKKDHVSAARKFGWVIVNLTHSCGKKIDGYLIDVRSSIADDLAVKRCPCGGSGVFSHEIVRDGNV